MERGVWTVRPDALFTKYHVRIVSIIRGASAFYRNGLAGRVCMISMVASLECPVEIRQDARWIKPVSENPCPSGFQGCRSTHMTVLSIPRLLVTPSIPNMQ